MTTKGPTCIVCGRPIKKKTSTIYFKDAAKHGKEPGSTDAGMGFSTYSTDLFVAAPVMTKTEAQRLVNQQIVSVSRSGDSIYSVGVWDGESYEDEFFDTGACARRQGYASARAGHRWKWKS